MESILNHIYTILKYKPTEKEKQNHIYECIILINQKLITEKILNKSLNNLLDNYNLGNYYISKEKDAEVNQICFTYAFVNKYMSKEDQQFFDYLKSQNLSSELINKYFIIYDNIKLNQITKSISKVKYNYIID